MGARAFFDTDAHDGCGEGAGTGASVGFDVGT
jgi:hypothetical protein